MMQPSEWMMNEINRQMQHAMNTELQATLAHTQTNKNETQFSKDLLLSAGVDLKSEPASYAVVAMSRIQVRKHKKRRINKKWAKRYGYKNSCPLKFGECVIIGDTMYMSQETYDVVKKSIPKGCSIHYNNSGGQIGYGKQQ